MYMRGDWVLNMHSLHIYIYIYIYVMEFDCPEVTLTGH